MTGGVEDHQEKNGQPTTPPPKCGKRQSVDATEMQSIMELLAEHTEAIQSIRISSLRAKRTPMGEYVVPPGGKPLTSLGDNMPAPSDYSPKADLTKPAAPHYSIAGRYKGVKPDYNASSADNDTSKDMTWNHRTITLKEKGKTLPYDIYDDADIDEGVGPAHYRIEHKGFGVKGPKWSVASRHLDGVNAGPPNSLVQPVDTQGHKTPGPNYRPNSSFWGRGPEKSFGSSRKDSINDAPGPAEYKMEDQFSQGPSYTLAKRLQPPLKWRQAIQTESPGPGAYDIGTTIGKAQAKSVTGRHVVKHKVLAPAPNMYCLPDLIADMPTATLTYRPFEVNEGPHPGPTKYSTSIANLRRAPSYSCRKRTKPAFPDILNYPLIAQKHHPPGPGRYEDNRNMSMNDKPKFSMGHRAREATNSVPGPNHYKMKVSHQPDRKRAPAFSMGRRVEPMDCRVSPGPASYYPQPVTGGPGHSMTKRPKTGKNFITPAPNAYLVKGLSNKGQTFMGAGASFKSRASPYVYSGFATTALSG